MIENYKMESTERRVEDLDFVKKPSLNSNLRKDQSVKLISNYMKISLKSNDRVVTQYHMSFTPTIAADNDDLRKKLYRGIKPKLKNVFHPFVISGDSLFTANRNAAEEIALQFTCTLSEGEEIVFQVTIRRTTNELDLTNFRSTIQMTASVKSFLEILVKNILNANRGMVRFNKSSIYNFESAVRLQDTEKAFLMPGYSTNIAVTESGIFLRVLFKNKFVNGKTCYERLIELQKDHKNGNYLAAVRNEFKGKQVMATYGKHKVYTIDEISESNVQNRTMPFRMPDGSENEITLERYYQIQYNKEIQDKKCLLFVTTTKNAKGDSLSLYLVPELLFMTGMDESMRANESFKKNMTNRTKVTPQERMNKIYDFKKLLEQQSSKKATRINRQTGEEIIIPDANDIRNEWGLSVTEFKEFQGRILEPPKILFAQNEISGIQGGKFRGKKLVEPVHLNSNIWAAICTERNGSVTEKMLRSLSDCSRNLGVNVDKPQIYSHHGRNPMDWIDFLKEIDLSKYRIVLIVLDRSSKNFYSDIKNYIYSAVGIPCQVVLTDNASKNLSYYSNVLTQMQAKLGGRPYQIYLDDNLNKNPSMVVGYECSKHGRNQKKYVMSASYDPSFSLFYTDEVVSENEDENTPIGTLLRRCLDYFFLRNKICPGNIILYRSGVSDSEKRRNSPITFEVLSIRDLLSGEVEKSCYKEKYKPKFCFCVVNKRTEAKFFEYSDGRINNPKEGMVIDSGATYPEKFEFYLQPQYVNSGTATPTYIHCIYDNTGIPLEILENITYKMCYYYWNWSGAIREPAVLKFAEQANKFSSSHMKYEVRNSLKNCPYYI